MNKNLLLIILLVTLFVSCVSALPTTSDSPADEWWMFGGDTGFHRYTTANAPANISNASVKTITLGQDVDNSPVIVGESLFIIPDSNNYDEAYELNASNVSQIIAMSTGTYEMTTSMTHYRDSLFFHVDSNLRQINASNLSQIIDTESITDAFYQATPTVYDNSVYVGDGNYWPKIRQFNASNISHIQSTHSSGSRIYDSTPVLNGYAYGASSSRIYLLNASNLAQDFGYYSCSSYNQGIFAVDDDYVYKSCGNDLAGSYTVQLNASDITQLIASNNFGNLLWKGGPVLGNGYIYFGESSTNLYQFNASNISQHIANYSVGVYMTTPALVTPDYVFIAASNIMYQFNATNVSHLISTYTAGGTINGGPVVARGFLYFGSTNNMLYQLGVENLLAKARVSYPVAEEIYLNVTELNYTLVGNLTWDSCWWSNSTANSSAVSAGTNFAGVTSLDGWNNWTLFCNQTDNTLHNHSITFYVDTDTPAFSSIANQTFNDADGLVYDIDATDNGKIDSFAVNDTTNFKINTAGVLENNTLLTVGFYWLNITVNDSVGHQNSTIITANVTDGTPPIINITYPLNKTNYSYLVSELNYSVTDNVQVNTCWWTNSSGFWNSTTQSAGLNWTGINVLQGWNNWTVYCNDSWQNTGSEDVKFIVDTVKPNVTLNEPIATYTTNYHRVKNVTFNCTGYDNFGVKNISLYITDNTNSSFVANQSTAVSGLSSEVTWTVGLENGNYTWNCLVYDTLENLNWSSNRSIEINPDVTSPAFTNITNQSLNQNVSLGVQISVNDTFPISCFGVNDSDFKINCSGYLENNSLLGVGLYWLNISVNDTANNFNYSSMFVNVSLRPILDLNMITPIGNINASQNKSFVVSVNVSCSNTDCGVVNVSLDPEVDSATSSPYTSGSLANGCKESGDGTVDTCADGSTCTYPFQVRWISIEDLNNSQFEGGDTVNVTFTTSVGCCSPDAVWAYSNDSAGEGNFRQMGRTVDIASGLKNYSKTFVLDDVVGNHTIRAINIYSAASTSLTCGYDESSGSSYSDSDDIVIYVGGDSKSGLVSMNISATPFNTYNQNPYNLTLNNGESQVITWNVNATGVIGNNYTFFIFANTTSDLSIGAITEKWNVTINNLTGIAPPTVTLRYPVHAGEYGSAVTELNYTVVGQNLSVCWYSIDGGATNSSYVDYGINFTGLSSVVGSNTWTVYCNLTNNTIGSGSAVFSIDVDSPLINFTSPTLASGVTTLDNFAITNVSIVESDLSSLIYNWNGTNYTMFNDSIVVMMNFDNRSALSESDNQVADIGLNTNNGTGSGVVLNTSCVYGNCFLYGGDGDHIDMGSITALQSASSFTVSFWAWDDDYSANACAFAIRDGTDASNLFSFYPYESFGGNGVRIWYDGVSLINEDDATRTGWNHFVFVSRNATDHELYVNGVSEGTSSTSKDLPASIDNVYLGMWYTGSDQYFDGFLDEFVLLDYGLTDEEVSQLYFTNLYKVNSTLWGLYVNQSKDGTSALDDANYSYQVYADDSFGNLNMTEQRSITIQGNTAPTIVMNYPSNNSLFSNVESLLLNATVYDVDTGLNNLTVWFYGGNASGTYSLLNTSYNQTNGTTLSYSWEISDAGAYNWTVIVNDERTNTSTIQFFNLSTLNFTCNVGGPYQQGALVLVQGDVSNASGVLAATGVNASVYDSDGVLNISRNLTTDDDGSYETLIYNLSAGSYTLNASTSYQGSDIPCIDTFSIGGSALFVLDKVATIFNISNSTINYNITLRVTNRGLADATSVNLTDDPRSYDLSTVNANSSVVRSYLANFTREDTLVYQLLSVATVNGTDSYSGTVISANSTELNLTIPDTEAGKQMVIVKNVVYVNETSLNVTYNVSVTLYNSGSEDIANFSYVDTDLNGTAFTLNLSEGVSSMLSNLTLIDKAASNSNHQFALGTATTTDLTVFYSNRPTVRIPGYGGPADATVYALSSVDVSVDFDTVVSVINQNPDIGQDFIIDYWITNDAEDTNYTSGQQTIYVGSNSTTNFTATLTSPSSNGDYRFRIIVTWAGGTAPAYDSFVVEGAVESSGGGSSGGGSGITGGATQKVVCDPPYIRHGIECCLDQNNNTVCDGDEEEEEKIEEVVEEGVKELIEIMDEGEEINLKIIQEDSIETYPLEIIDLQLTSATFVIDSQEVTLSVGQGQNLDLDGDGFFDVFVMLEKVENGQAHVQFEAISGEIKIEESELVYQAPRDPTSKNFSWIYYVLGFIVFIVVGVFVGRKVMQHEGVSLNLRFIKIEFLYGFEMVKEFFRNLLEKMLFKKKKAESSEVLLGNDVYSADGETVGKVVEIVVSKKGFGGLLVDMSGKKVLIKPEQLRSVHPTVISTQLYDLLK
ncbi:hypothetical protein HOC80_03940 [archaeon]|jgi:hypothetical protein|nr:hypothetical protein [archaeon]MBT4417225.1 hypothetical protein [archaeon]